MRRITISLDESLARQFDTLAGKHGYQNRSEAVRDLVRQWLETERVETGSASGCVASVSYVYNHHERELAQRLTGHQHEHHDLCLSTLHVHLDHDNCMETVILKGPMPAVQAFANELIAERGVRHGNVHLVPVEMDAVSHKKGHSHVHLLPHIHLRPKT
jgi:CopG family nickel-responsive transcriptional regulator